MISRWKSRAAWAATVAAVVGACGLALPWQGGAQGAQPASGVAMAGGASDAGGPLAWHACRIHGLEHDAQCASLRRPLDPEHPTDRRFDLQVARLPALARQKLPDPVFFFAGGPGQSAIALAGTIEALTARLGDRRDIVLIDQRGTGHSAPLQCDAPSADEALRRVLDRGLQVAALRACRHALQALPWGDLRFFTTSLAVGDVEAVRDALGAARVDLVGASYGTRVALEYMRQYPTHVRRVVLDGVVPPDMALPESGDRDAESALQALLRDCAASATCARAHPALEAHWQQLVAAPMAAGTLTDPLTGRTASSRLTPAAMFDLIRPALYQPTLGAALPYAIDEAAAGRPAALLALGAGQAGASPGDISEGEHFSVICSEDAPRLGELAPTNGPRYDAVYRAVCADWPRGGVPDGFHDVPRSAVPVLLLSGGIDPVTPPRHAARVAAALGPLARQAVVAHASHGVLGLPCIREALHRFIDAAQDDDALAVDLHCADALPRPLDFVPPEPALGSSAPNDPHAYAVDRTGESHAPDRPPLGLARFEVAP